MDITSTPPRVELAVSPARTEMRANTGTMTGPAETRNPVTAADATQASAEAKKRAIEPLDVFQVGDNDDKPVPPEPPRQPLAMLAMSQPAPEDTEDTASDADGGTGPQGDDDTASGPTQGASPATAVAPMEAYQGGVAEPVNRTVDIRR